MTVSLLSVQKNKEILQQALNREQGASRFDKLRRPLWTNCVWQFSLLAIIALSI